MYEYEYEEFLDFCEKQGLEFPCTAGEFHARAAKFACGDEALINILCQQGIGPNWADE